MRLCHVSQVKLCAYYNQNKFIVWYYGIVHINILEGLRLNKFSRRSSQNKKMFTLLNNHNMGAFPSTSNYYDLLAEERYEILASSWGLLTTSNSSQEEEEPARSNLGSSSSNPSHTMSRSKCYKLDLSSHAAAMPLSSISQQHGADEPVS